jgi:RecA/RadA recombinase
MEQSERRKKLEATLKAFNKIQKTEIFTMGSDIEEFGIVPSGVKKLDEFIGGGFKKGTHTIIFGAYSVGKTAIVLQTIAHSQKNGLLVCYVNTEAPIDPERFRFFGVNLSDLVYIEAPENAEQALEAMRTLCRDKIIDVFIIDSTNGLSPKSSQEGKEGQERELSKKDVAALPLTLSNFYNKVNALVFKSKAAVIWLGQTRKKGIGGYFVHDGLTGGSAQEFYAHQIIKISRGTNDNAPSKKIKSYFCDPNDNTKVRFETIKENCGYDAIFKLEKTKSSKSRKEKSETHIPYIYAFGFVDNIPEVEDEIQIDPEATPEQKEIITAFLIEKGILPLSKEEIKDIENSDKLNAEIDEAHVADVEEPIIKKRGRKQKEKK